MTRRIVCALVGALAAVVNFGGAARAAEADGAVVRTRLGPVRGVVADGVASFKGMPFAAPPVGPLRWRPPQPARPWREVRDAREFGPACMQGERTLFAEDKVQSEDCLTINVWTPAGARKLPVMVWIYGGGFSMGSTRPPLYSGANFARQGVVMVSLQYRVARFGFFAHPALTAEDPDGPLGNFAILDQIAGLTWVRDNIAAFGGDPSNVTIFGESAGGVSVNALMATPAARGLFAKAISESGFGRTVGLPLRAGDGPSGEAEGLAFAKARGVEGQGPDAAAALRALPAAEVLGPAGPPGPPPSGQARQPGGAPGGLPYPFIDGVLFKEQIWQTFAAGRQAQVPYLAGGNSYEASLFGFVRREPQAAFAATGRPEEVRALYVRDGRDEGLAALDLVTDLHVTEPARFLARAVARTGPKAFVYHFDYVPPAQRATAPGAAHGAELGYVFGVLPPTAPDEARALSRAIGAYWVAFAKTGDPGSAGGPAWAPTTASAAPIMVFGPDGPELRPEFMAAKLDLLESLSAAPGNVAQDTPSPPAAGRGSR